MEITQYNPPSIVDESTDFDEGKAAFLVELLVRRELTINFVLRNPHYEIDGSDANGYTGIAWAIGGKHDRPWGPERPIFGLLRYMSLGGMQRKFDTQAYVKRWNSSPRP